MRDEIAAAEILEKLAPRVLGRELGPRTKRDARDDSGLRVDFTYESCSPAIALEVTGIHAPKDRQLWGEIDKRLEPELSQIASEEQLGSWVIVLKAGADIRALLGELPNLMREKVSFRPGEYSSDDLLALQPEERRPFVDTHDHLQHLGLVEIEYHGTGENSVRCMAFGQGGEILGFEQLLAEAMTKNAEKLGEVGDREKHLAVFVYDFQASRLVERTPLPLLPPEVDCLWVIHTWPRMPGRPEVWIGRRDDTRWRREVWSSEMLKEGR